jgi:DNA polymerase V
MRGRMFGQDTSEFHVIEAAIASLAASAAFELRREHQLARKASVFISTNRNQANYRRFGSEVHFLTPTADTGALTVSLVHLLQEAYQMGLRYHRAGITLYDLVPDSVLQTDFWGDVNLVASASSQKRLKAIDQLNSRFGSGTVHYAAEDLSTKWQPKHMLRSPRYVSSWNDLPKVKIYKRST